MGQTSNREPRRLWRASESNRARVPCASCGAPARPHSPELPFCNACLDWARQSSLVEGQGEEDRGVVGAASMHRGGGSATAGSKACSFAARDMFWPSSGTAAASAVFHGW